MKTPLVRSGEDYFHLDRESRTRRPHTMATVYGEMLLQVCRLYSGLPDVRTLTNREVRFFYEGLRDSLKEATAPPNE